MAKRRPTRPKPFIPKQDRPEVSTLLDKPIRDLTPRELSAALHALGIPAAPATDPLSAEALVALPSDLIEQSFEIALREALPESLLRELSKYGVPDELIRTAPPETLLAELPAYGVPDRLITLLKGRLKDIVDAKRWIDKAVRDGKPRVDKAIRDNKARIDKWILDKKGVLKDLMDTKDIKDYIDGYLQLYGITPGTTSTASLAERLNDMRRQFEAIEREIAQQKGSRGSRRQDRQGARGRGRKR